MRKLIGLLVMFSTISGLAYAANPNSCEVSCTPSVSYSVLISTPAAGFAFGVVNLNTSYVYPATALITNNGNITAAWKIKATAINNWALGAAPGNNVVRLLAVLKSTLAVSADFNTTNDVLTTVEQNMDATKYTVDQTGNDVPVDGEMYDGARSMSVRLDSPTGTDFDTQQKFRIDIKAYPSSSF